MSTLAERLPDLIAALAARRRAVVATLFRVKGSSPAAVGARLVMDERGEVRGTVGGGCLDGDVLHAARRLLAGEGGARTVAVDLTGREESHALSCGGIAEVFLERVDPDRDGPLYRALAESLERGVPAALATVIGDAAAGAAEIGAKRVISSELPRDPTEPHFGAASGKIDDAEVRATADALAERAITDDRPLFEASDPTGAARHAGVLAEPVAAPTVYVLGCGHVGAALGRLLVPLGFRAVMVDDREAFANATRLPFADEVRVLPFERLDELDLRHNAHVVIVTRGHRFDAQCLRWALGQETRYLGMIGSRAKLKRIKRDLIESGVDEARFERLHCPIGLDIGALTVEEIAVSIAAELVAVRRGKAS